MLQRYTKHTVKICRAEHANYPTNPRSLTKLI